MNNKIPLYTISERLAAQAGVTVDEAQKFIKELFAEITDSLADGKQFELKGLGRFITMPNPASPVKFTPDRELADELNAPFAMFEAVEFGDEITADQLNNISTPELPQADEATLLPAPQDATDELALTDQLDITSDNQDLLPEVAPESDDAVDEPEATRPVITTGPEIPMEMELPDMPELPDVSAASVAPVVPELPKLPELPEISETEETSEADNESESDGCIIDGLPETCVEPIQPEQSAQLVSETPSSYIPEDEEEYVEYHNAPKSRFGLGFFLGIITGLIIAALALAAYVIFFTNNATGIL